MIEKSVIVLDYCLIEPNESLKRLLRQNLHLAQFFGPEIIYAPVWGRPRYSRNGMLYIKQVFYLAVLYDRLCLLRDPMRVPDLIPAPLRKQTADFLHSLLGEPPIHTEIFEVWWTSDFVAHVDAKHKDLPHIHHTTVFNRLPVEAFEALYESYVEGWDYLETLIEWKSK